MPHPADVAFADQANAAEAHLQRILEHTADRLLGDDHRNAEPAPWLTARLDAFMTAVELGTVQLCEHLAEATAPRPAFGILSRPRLVCPACARNLAPAGDVHCDRCGQPTAELEPALANLGTIALLILQCDPCARTP